MKIIIIAIMALLPALALISCGNNVTNSSVLDKDSAVSPVWKKQAPQKDTLMQQPDNFSGCYRRLSGFRKRDTAMISLQINGDKVEGSFTASIYEKDIRQGSFKGTIQDSVVNALWIFTQEGMKDTLPLVFRMDGKKLLQKRFSYNPKTGREFVPDTASFSAEFKKTGCDE